MYLGCRRLIESFNKTKVDLLKSIGLVRLYKLRFVYKTKSDAFLFYDLSDLPIIQFRILRATDPVAFDFIGHKGHKDCTKDTKRIFVTETE